MDREYTIEEFETVDWHTTIESDLEESSSQG